MATTFGALGGSMGGPRGLSFFDQMQIENERLRGPRPGGIIPVSSDQMDALRYSQAILQYQKQHDNHMMESNKVIHDGSLDKYIHIDMAKKKSFREKLQEETTAFLRKHNL